MPCLFLSRPVGHPVCARALTVLSLLMIVCSLVAQTAVASDVTNRLETVTITATRTPSSPQTLGSVVDSISAADLARRQISSLSQALAGIGAPVFSSGQRGATTAIFLRGANSNQTLFLVDGLRLNDPNTDYAVFLGGACVSSCDSLEIAHGPQSTLYGGEAVGGVISLRSVRGAGAPGGRIALEAGRFGTFQGAISSQGESDVWAYNVAFQGGRTENHRVNNDFQSGNFTFRLDRRLNEHVAVGATVRGFQAVYGSPGSRFSDDPDNEEREGNWLGTVFADLQHSSEFRSHAVLGGQHRRFVSENPTAGAATLVTVVKNRRAVLDWQSTYEGFSKNRITAGFTAEGNHTRNTGFGDIDDSQSLLAFFAQDEITPVENVYLTAGVRHDDFDTFGRHTTGKVSAAWGVLPGRIKLRASFGTAFRSPSFLDLYGTNAFYVGNPALRPERARGGDVGLDFTLSENKGTLSVTWFENRFKELIVADFSRTPGSVANLGRATTRGAEVSLLRQFPAAIQLRASYTYLEAENESANIRLLRRPRQSGNVDLWSEIAHGVSAGAGLRIVAQREDVHAGNYSTIDAEDYSVVRVYAAWTVSDCVTLRVRVENVLDESYEEVHGYPQLPLGGFTSVEWRW